MTRKVPSLFFLLGLSLCFILALFFISQKLKPIEEKRFSVQQQSLLSQVYPSASHFSEKIKGKTIDYWKALNLEGELLGFVFLSEWEGYRTLIKVAVGVSRKGEILQVQIREQNETPGFDQFLRENLFLNQFQGKKGSELSQVTLVTGATVSSQTVRHIVREGVQRLFRNEVLIEE